MSHYETSSKQHVKLITCYREKWTIITTHESEEFFWLAEHWWWMLHIWVQPRNQGLVITLEASIITKAKKVRQMRSKLKWCCLFSYCGVVNMHKKIKLLSNIFVQRFTNWACKNHATGSYIVRVPCPLFVSDPGFHGQA